MWKGPDQDPGGDPGPSQELSELKDQFEQQQVLIAQLKEMIRKNEQSSVTQEKVDEYMNTLSKRGRVKRQKKDDENRKTVDIPASQKISLLRQQVEENKARLAERGKSQKGIEEMVTQLKAQLDDSQQLISQTPLNLSLQDSKIEYSENSSAQELYMTLLTKEKRISDLLTKVQKLESNVLDLQENLKEKDSVIDARTKAITLMTENLSRKGKSTLDALDETKEQMRKMQESFITMEADMKARQMKLLDDLRQKNYEIAELQEVNERLEKQIIELKEDVTRETSRENLEVLKAENARLALVITEKSNRIRELEEEQQGEETSKLKKQLEDSNKNMIKVKAQHKSKVKELTKKIEAFKKVSDANAEIVKLESENCRLSQKIAELEEEKGSLQLKLVESDSAKGSDLTEHTNELEEKLQDREQKLEEKDKVISILEAEILQSKVEIEFLSEKLNSLPHLENDQVKSEMASIQFEEQMDSVVNENKKLSLENESIVKEKEELLETIEQLKKENQEIASKLEHYIQENMELIDKLEKLSAEKVSSAESIEIVEGLTQQEKLELEAYQKNLDIVTGNMKSSEENLPQVDLNESLSGLTEETSDLLQRIELFTVERREVMEKMEQLKQENLNLNLKIKEIENNRDVLAETYEQVQSEKEVLGMKLETVEAENVSLKEQLSQPKEEKIDESGRVKELEEEIANTKLLIEEKQSELDILNKLVEDLKLQLEDRNKENGQLNNTIIDLNRTLADLENDNKSLQMKITQLEEHKTNLSQLIDKNQEELEAISNSEWENRRLLESKDNEITKLTKERDNTESVIVDLQKTIKEKDEKFHKMTSDLKEKYLNLQKKLEDNSGSLQNITGPLETKIEELTVKNKEQLEKMKKIAANLKKKTQAYQELEDKFKESQNRHDVELKTSLQQLQDLEAEVSRLQQQFDDKCDEGRVLEEKNVDLQNIIADLKVKADRSNEVNLQQELLLTKENLGSIEGSLRDKIQELEMIVETQESELAKTRERVTKLEEGISFVEERRLSLERKANELGAQLEEKSITCEEMSRSEDFLENRLAALIAHDEAIERKLEEAISDNQELSQQNQNLVEKNEKLKKKLVEIKEKVHTMEDQQNFIEDLETQNDNFKKQIHNLENDLKNLRIEYDKMLEESRADLDKVNGDWQNQFEEILAERSELMIKCEKFEEELKEITEKDIVFNDALVEYKTKLESSEVQIRNYEEQIQTLSQDKEEMKQLREMLEEKDNTIKNYEEKLEQTLNENETLIRNYEEKIQALSRESEDLRRIITEKETEINALHQQKNSNNLAAFFDNIPQEDPTTKLQEDIATSKSKIEELEKIIDGLEAERTAREDLITKLQQEAASSKSKIVELQQLEAEKSILDQELTELRKKIHDFPSDTPVSQKDIPVFHWSGQDNDPFDFVEATKTTTQEAPPPQKIENTQEELLEKIKTLQFMLFDVEKEKDDALHQCQELTNELTRLIYEKQTALESQILQQNETRDSTELQKIEFEETKPPVVSSLESGPIIEEMIQPKEAYLCYSDEKEDRLEGIESQVLSEGDVVDSSETRQQLEQIEFEVTHPPTSSTDRPITEEPCGSKDAYLCFGENDDGWGWGPDEAKLEEEHAQKLENVEGFRQRIRVLEMERENHVEEIRQLQVKSGKLIKKLKEMKAKNEELAQRKKSEGDLFNLDDAIQEELKLQIQQVEKRLKETSTELEKEKNEKAAILKRIDVLAAANERMVEMKEKQDIEMLGWQQNYRELSAKLERFEWGDDGFSSMERQEDKLVVEEKSEDLKVLQKKIEELNETIRELSLDNEELQALLEEQRKLRIEAEKSTVQFDHSGTDVLELEKEKESLNNELQIGNEERRQLRDQVNELIKKNAELGERLELLQKEHVELGNLALNKDEIVQKLNEKVANTERERQEISIRLQQELQEKNAITEEKDVLLKELQENSAQIAEKEILFKELQEKNAQIDSLRESIDAQVSSLKAELDNQIKTAEILTGTISTKDTEIVRLTAAMEQMTQEWQMRIDQRGSDVAESWKLHLESRESEVAQTEELLRKEINELEEKTNALVNENNELRKNVDAEIRNEVDRVAALQQQINDRQQCVSDLTRTLQEKQTEVEKLQKYLDDEKGIVDAVFKVVHEYSTDDVVERNIGSLVKVLKDKENAVLSLQQELEAIKVKLNRSQEEHARTSSELGRLNGLLEEREQTIAALNAQIQEMRNLKDYENENTQNLQQNLYEYQQINNNINVQLQTKVAQLDEKEREIVNLKLALEEKEREHAYAVENISQEYKASIDDQAQEIETLKRRLIDTDNHYEELLSGKDLELEGVQLELRHRSEMVEDLQRKIDEQTVLIDEENKQLTELRAIIEEQVLKIEELKNELYEKSNDYDSLIAEMDISRTKESETQRQKDDDLTEPVSRAELDLALYMLHQRDVRCEELTVELTQLLEERDTLQLRLSNVLREKEELAREATQATSSSSTETAPEVAVEAFDPLTTKLSELKTIGYKKDKTIVDEQELRRMQQMSIMQQHRDAASKLPPEAAARLVDASYTLSRDVQSPSKVLLNWLWGRSTPKVNNV